MGTKTGDSFLVFADSIICRGAFGMRCSNFFALLFAIALTGCDAPPGPKAIASGNGADEVPAPPIPPPHVGRWTIVHSPQTEKDVILLDTATGETWSETEDKAAGTVQWEPMLRLSPVPAVPSK